MALDLQAMKLAMLAPSLNFLQEGIPEYERLLETVGKASDASRKTVTTQLRAEYESDQAAQYATELFVSGVAEMFYDLLTNYPTAVGAVDDIRKSLGKTFTILTEASIGDYVRQRDDATDEMAKATDEILDEAEQLRKMIAGTFAVLASNFTSEDELESFLTVNGIATFRHKRGNGLNLTLSKKPRTETVTRTKGKYVRVNINGTDYPETDLYAACLKANVWGKNVRPDTIFAALEDSEQKFSDPTWSVEVNGVTVSRIN